MNELFTIPESKSPRLKWMEAHNILTHYSKDEEDPWLAIQPMEEDKGESVGECMARNCQIYEDHIGIGYGKSEEEAIINLAKKLKLPLWNELDLPR